jgi:signal transduction histidine kinase/CheY-like chemotaxis protein/methylphosphotriester-DNA--protein-cysteine methyltransferase
MKLLERPESAFIFLGGFFFAMAVLHLILYAYNKHKKANVIYAIGLIAGGINYSFVEISTSSTFTLEHAKMNIILNTISNGILLYFVSYYLIASFIPVLKRIVQILAVLYTIGFIILAFSEYSSGLFNSTETVLRVTAYITAVCVCVLGLVNKIPNFALIVAAAVLLMLTEIFIAVDIFGLWHAAYSWPRNLLIILGYSSPFVVYSAYLSKDLALTSKKLMKEHIMNEQLTQEQYRQEMVTRKILESQKTELEQSVRERTREIMQKNEQLEQQAEKIQEVDKIKTRFFANISHEFRTPLTLILAPLKKRLKETTNERELQELNLIYQNANRLLQLVNQLLDMARLESRTWSLRASITDLGELAMNIGAAFHSLAETRSITYRIESKSPVQAYIDREKLDKILINLVGNAFKFTPPGGSIVVSVEAKAGNEQFPNGYAELKVRDNGIGIAQKDLPRIFERFYQVDATNTRQYEGTGIGLSLVSELVELHKGTIHVKSEIGLGSSFIIHLPLGKDHLSEGEILQSDEYPEGEPLPNVNSRSPEEEEDSSKEKVLVVEDNETLRTYLKQIFNRNYRVFTAADGKEGLSVALKEIPELIISDVMMPNKDGIQFCEDIKRNELTSHIPVILLTARTDNDSILEGLHIGADDYIPKPFDIDILEARMQNLIENRKALRKSFAGKLALRPKSPEVVSADDRFLKKVMDTIEKFIGDSSFTVESMSAEIGVSSIQLYRKLKALTDMTPNDFIRNMRLIRASDLLAKKAGNVAEVAYQTGFNNLSYFSKCFREKFGVPPSEFSKTVNNHLN